jgi:hypothetical protein
MENRSEDLDDGIIPNRHLLPYGTSTGDAPIRLVDRAKEIEMADMSIQAVAGGKMELILKQIRQLQSEAKLVLEEAQKSAELHRIKCNFEKKIGQTLHLYQKSTGEKYFSMLSPEEWGNPPHLFIGSYLLKADQTFEEI